jgi:hypothetical protein
MSGDLNSSVPAAVWIGVTGHRSLKHEDIVRQSVKNVLSKLESIVCEKSGQMPWTFVIVSPLAEGADRLVARETLNWPGKMMLKPLLEIVLPMTEKDYMQDFATETSRNEFKAFQDDAVSIIELLGAKTREDAYQTVGKHVVNRCDVLIAIWDGKEARGKGGTAEIVKYAKKRKRLIFWINSETGKVTNYSSENDFVRFKKDLHDSTKNLDNYNKEKLNSGSLEAGIKSRRDKIENYAKDAGLAQATLQNRLDNLMPGFVRATLLARKYQRIYIRSGIIISILSAVAVATVVIQVFFLSNVPQILWLEVGWMSIIITLLISSSYFDWRRKWVDYRLLAELLRASIYSRIVKDLQRPKYLKGDEPEWASSEIPVFISSFLLDDWRNWAFSWITLRRTRENAEISFGSLRSFILKAWIDDQINYYQKTSERYFFRHEFLDKAGLFLFGLTLVAAILHSTGIGHTLLQGHPSLPNLLTCAAIIFPAVGSSLAGIKIYREYLFNAKRYKHISNHLLEIRDEIAMAGDLKTLASLVDEAERIMLSEHMDWCEITQIRGPPA